MTQQSSAKGEIIAHTSLRGVGAIGVIVYHFLYFYTPNGTRLSLVDILPNYALILELFFVNSGFIMSYMYYEHFSSRIARSSTSRFFWARFARIYPVHLLALALYVVAHTGKYLLPAMNPDGPMTSFFAEPNTPMALLASILMIQAWGINWGDSWNFVSWAVSAELAAYLTFPLLCLVIGRLGKLGLFLVFAYSMGLYWFMQYHFGGLNLAGTDGAPRCMAGFALGCVLYQFSPVLRLMTTRVIGALQTFAVAAMLVAYGFASSQILVIFAVGLLVFSTSENRGWVSNALAWQPLRSIGQWSFTLYLTHAFAGMAARPVIYLLGNAIGDTQSIAWSFAVLAIKSAAALPFAYLVFKYFEMPMRDWLVLQARKRRTAAAAAE
jgi:peptidoglycan/LPS O-acetylase OafA/YrhL